MASRRRKEPLKSTTRIPCARSFGASSYDTSLGVQRNAVSTSREARRSGSCGVQTRLDSPRSCGWISPSGLSPVVSEAMTAAHSIAGCRRMTFISSSPEYPVTPTAATRIFMP